MKQWSIHICVLLLVICSGFTKNPNPVGDKNTVNRNLVDSLVSMQHLPVNGEQNADKIIKTYESLINGGSTLKTNDYKELAISYAIKKDANKASSNLEIYIKNSLDLEVLTDPAFDNIKNSPSYLSLKQQFRPQYNFWFMLYCYIGLIGIFIAVMLNLNKNASDKIANLLIGIFILLSSFFVLHVCLFITNVQFSFPHSLFSTITFNFLYGPLLYFYLLRITKEHKFKRIDLLHLLPFLIFLGYFSKYYALSAQDKLGIMVNRLDNVDPVLYVMVTLKVVSLLVYGYLIYKLYRNSSYRKDASQHILLNWKKNIVYLNMAYVVSHLLYVIMILGIVSMNFLIHPQLLAMSLFILFVGYTAYVQPGVFSGKGTYLDNLIYGKYQKSGLTPGLSNELKENLLQLFYQEKIYKRNDINLDLLSERLGANRHGTSQVINEHFNMNFFHLINKFRIQEALEIFRSDFNSNINIIGVAYEVGFNNKVTFNKAFKEETKMTPSQFIQTLQEDRHFNLNVNF